MATITGLTAERMQEIEDASIIDGEIVDGNLILTKHDGTTINAGPVIGPPGPTGPVGPASVGAVPGEVKLWPGEALPDLASYGKWVWADGAYYPVASHPKAAAHIATRWRTFDGASDPGAANFRVPDLRGLVAAGLDAMPGGTRANRMTRAVAITIASKTGKETHVITLPELASHSHRGDGQGGGGGVVGVNVNVNVSGGISGSTDGQGSHQHSASSGLGMAVTNQNRNLRTDGSSAYAVITAAELTNFAGHHAHGVGGSFSGSGSGSGSGGINADGGNAAHENVQPTVMVPYIVYLDVV
jgi:microcystin-dependent protein